ncbi:hypothetical protein L1987_47132 [Smallanthus sonchifolius]|uniref:Uncharacterized protein n=1 Tax=Smallanthus sonchifolius TaxID=185202 RepID=A0ACB9G1I5_9ASTR|nr:hypothetical protein L1987_47132 [Smallanthus sonchifolius]
MWEMKAEGLYPDEVAFKLIIGGLLHENKLFIHSLACMVWDHMMGIRVLLLIEIFQRLLSLNNAIKIKKWKRYVC